MKIRDISNQRVAEIASCDSEPIHIPGSIQPHGVLLALNDASVVACCSANTESAFGLSPADILNQTLKSVSQALFEKLREMEEAETEEQFTTTVALTNGNWQAFFTQTADHTLIELEPLTAGYSGDEIFDHTRRFTEHIERSRSLQDLCQRIADQTRSITGYDRVMIYRFDQDYNGEVYAESRIERVEPFLNLHYPHTDIPVQARELYLRNLMRMIADVHYTPVPLLTTENLSNESVDLSNAVLRSVSPIHIQYLKNMGVGASLTISLILEGKLWGLITCHHYAPMHLSYPRRKAALLQGLFLTSQIKVRQVAEEYEVSVLVEAHLQQLLNVVPQAGDFQLKFDSFSSLLSLTNATGVALLHKGKLYTKGQTPASDRVRQLFRWLATNTSGLQFSTSHLQKHYPDADKISRQASGILYHKLGDPSRDAIIWFKEELERTINWAGDPHEAIKKVLNNTLTPRSSFAIFKESVRCHSAEWRISEINAATRFASTLQNQFHLEHLQQEEAQQRMLNEKLIKANKELANINWITSHDLKEPLRKIMLFASKVIKDEEQQLSETIVKSIGKIQGSAMRMQNLVDDIVSYSMTDDKAANFVETDLNQIIKEVIREYEDDFAERKVSFVAGALPRINAIPYQMRQLFINLIGNAMKFAKQETPLSIEVTSGRALVSLSSHPLLDPEKTYHQISVKDNGIGFEPAQGAKLFDIFYRVHDRETYAGTGIGLAICKRIVENHGGIITATGEPGVGATFNAYLPE